MKSKLLLLTLVLFSYTYVNAQSSKEIEKMAKAETTKMVAALDLTDDQEIAIYRQNYTLVEQQSRFDKVENKTDKVVAAMENYKMQYQENVQKLLTDSQREQFKNWVEKSKLLKE
ncbi:hypothetical protein G3O08_12965 [Cryomorpha ignava]|uniref:Uncharacterized protein n=1 Tax=Cryomorpha ignava TaxID=101383 RepID=A0A7K3WUS6_9FLAO|nr:hypothetical protein [Cryomorpha ignava]NEN24415.1 hypothetical protein [Cryomorpha ignava]